MKMNKDMKKSLYITPSVSVTDYSPESAMLIGGSTPIRGDETEEIFTQKKSGGWHSEDWSEVEE